MNRYKLTIAYDGSNYHGWQIQDNGITVEEVVTNALSEVMGCKVEVIGASRTDAGVHALGNVAVFDADTRIPGDKLSYAINPHLPEDIRIVNSMQVGEDFHPRFTDSEKTYEYHIINARTFMPTLRAYVAFVPRSLDVDAMREAAKYLVGEHDFKSFCAAKAQVKTTVRKIVDIEIEEISHMPHLFIDGDQQAKEIIIRVTGTGFLYNMVRIIAGTLIKAGQHSFPPEYMKEIIEAKDRAKAGETAPAQGLFLKKIQYFD